MGKISKKCRQVYITIGSEDGNLGVFSSQKKALERAKQYMVQVDEKYKASWYAKNCLTVVKLISINFSATVERFWLI